MWFPLRALETATSLIAEQSAWVLQHLLMVVMAHLSFVSEHNYAEKQHVASLPHMISHSFDFTQILSTTLTCLTETASVSLYLHSSKDPDRQHLCCNNRLVAAAMFKLGSAQRVV